MPVGRLTLVMYSQMLTVQWPAPATGGGGRLGARPGRPGELRDRAPRVPYGQRPARLSLAVAEAGHQPDVPRCSRRPLKFFLSSLILYSGTSRSARSQSDHSLTKFGRGSYQTIG